MLQPRPRRSLIALASALALSSLLGACVVVPARGYYGGGETVMVAPPGPQVEVVGLAPGPGYFWMGGYWNWYGGRHSWVGGRWESQRQGYQWVPHQWHREGGGWRSAPGRWQQR